MRIKMDFVLYLKNGDSQWHIGKIGNLVVSSVVKRLC